MAPYNLSVNPFPSSPTPTVYNSNILGGKRHIAALNSIKACVDDLYGKLGNEKIYDDDLFKIITIIQDVGSGKTHLTLHTKTLKEFDDKSVISYVDLTQVQPREIDNFFHSIVSGFGKDYYAAVKAKFVDYLKDKFSQNPKLVKKIIRYGIMDSLSGNTITEKLEQIIQRKMNLSYEHLFELMSNDFTKIEISLITEIFKTSTLNYSDLKTFENLTMVLSNIAKINYKLFNKITIFQIDEFDTNSTSLEYLKGLINSHIPYSILMVVTTPSYYTEISRTSPSLFDRLEKANYKIDLAGSNSYDEVNDIVLQYVLHYNGNITNSEKKDLSAKVRIIYDEFPDFRNIRSILNVLYHAFEEASEKNSHTIDEQSIEETIKNVYPGLRLRGSIMDIPISDFLKMRKISIDRNLVETNVRNAVRNLINYFEQLGTVKRYDDVIDGEFLDAAYNDQMGKKVGISIAMDFDKNKNFDKILKSTKRNSAVDKLVILTTNMTTIKKNGTTLVTIDKWKLADLLYFSKKYDSDEIGSEDPQKAMLLAKSIQIC